MMLASSPSLQSLRHWIKYAKFALDMKKSLFILIFSTAFSALPTEACSQQASKPGLFEKMRIKKSEREAKRRRKAAYEEWQRDYNARKERHLKMQDEKTRLRMQEHRKRDRKEAQRRDHSWWERMKMRL